MKKMLMLASVASMIDQFNMSNIEILQDMGYEVHVAANFEKGNTSSKERVENFKNELKLLHIPYYQIDFERNITKIGINIKAYKQIVKLINNNHYEFIHCHSPIGGVCGRLAAHKTNTRVIYTAHGFHFYKGAPMKNWLLYYPVERFLARYTDVIITINQEDYARAQKFNSKKVVYIPGVGINTKIFNQTGVDKLKNRRDLGIKDDQIVLLSVGELSKRKNHKVIIKALAKLNNPNIIYMICGKGALEDYLVNLARKLNVNVKFLGFRKDIPKISTASDIYVFPSYQEGLPVALMESMAVGLPIICSDIRGNNDLIENGKGGFLIKPSDVDGFTKAIDTLIYNENMRNEIKLYNNEIIKNFDEEHVENEIVKIYKQIIT